MKTLDGTGFPGWEEGGGFELPTGRIGWCVRNGLFWAHSLNCSDNGNSAARLVQAVRKEARRQGFTRLYFQVVPPNLALLNTLAKGRSKIDFVQMFCET